MVETGSISIFLAFVVSVYTLIASFTGGKYRNREFINSAEHGAFAVFFF